MENFEDYLNRNFGVRKDDLTPEQISALKNAFDAKNKQYEDGLEETQKAGAIASHMLNVMTKKKKKGLGIESEDELHTHTL